MSFFLHLLILIQLGIPTDAYWRMTCGTIQTGRVDPIVSPGVVAGHVHKMSGASTVGLSSTFASLQNSRCTSCEVQDDLSAYWTPQLYYAHTNGTFEEVPNGGTVVYYLGRGDNRAAIQPFPAGFRMVSGDTNARSYNSATLTYLNGRPVSDRVSFACLSSKGGIPETPSMVDTDCDNGLRSQIQMQSCWDGQNLYLPGNAHVDYMSQIDNGVCPPTHPVQLIHLFYEVYYGVNDIDKSKGGQFVFANGDPTGYGFHGDFLNGWDNQTLVNGIKQCVNNDSITSPTACPAFASSEDLYSMTNCPELPPIVNEPVHGLISKLPGCNPITHGPGEATPGSAQTACSLLSQQTTKLNSVILDVSNTLLDPLPGYRLGTWDYAGCANEIPNGRALGVASLSNSTGMTVEACTAYCQLKNLPLAGLEFGQECWCGNALTSPATLLSVTTCNSTAKMVCSGNSSEWCGAPSFLTIWNNTAWVSPIPVIGQSTAVGGKAVYAGCYSEATGIRALSKAATSGTNNTIMTNDLCGIFCMGKGYSLFGTEYAQECYCGNSLEAGSVINPPTDCNMQCVGNASTYCGAGNRLSVWNGTALAAAYLQAQLSSIVSSTSISIVTSTSSTASTSTTKPATTSTSITTSST